MRRFRRSAWRIDERGGRRSAPAPFMMWKLVSSGVRIEVLFGLSDLTLRLPFHLLGLPLQLLARVAGQVASGVADLAADLLRRALDLVLEPIPFEIVCHGFESSLNWEGRSGNPRQGKRCARCRTPPGARLTASCTDGS